MAAWRLGTSYGVTSPNQRLSVLMVSCANEVRPSNRHNYTVQNANGNMKDYDKIDYLQIFVYSVTVLSVLITTNV